MGTQQQHGLGRGLDALFRNGNLPLHETQDGVVELPVFKLKPCAGQPRKIFDETALKELAASIKTQGVIQPLLVRPLNEGFYEIIAGERRWRAAQRAGLSKVPVVVRKMNDDDALTASLIENLQREDLNPVEEAQAMATLRDKLRLSQEALADRIGKSRSAVANALRLLQLPEEIIQALQAGTVTPGHARGLMSVEDAGNRMKLFYAIISHGLSVRQTEDIASQIRETGLFPEAITAEAPKKEKNRSPRMAKSENIKATQLRLRASLHPKVTIAGTEAAGRITVPYDSPEKFEALIKVLLDASEN